MRKESLVGQTFGRLLVVEELPSKNPNNKRPSWKCFCSCGNPEPVIAYRGTSLKSGNTRSCGCLKSEISSDLMTQLGESQRQFEPREATARYVYFAKYNNTNKGDTITFDEFYELSQLDCFYCGKPPSNKRKPTFPDRSEHYKNNCEFIYNGLDRIDNTLPHTRENCVASCIECNLSKRNMTIDRFYSMIIGIYDRRNIPIPNFETLFTSNDKNLEQFKRVRGQLMATYRDITFDMNLFYFILTLECFYCGSSGSNTKRCKNGDTVCHNGLDRLDQTKGHTLDNIVPCCKYCNWSKAGRSYLEFRAWAERVYLNRGLCAFTLSNS